MEATWRRIMALLSEHAPAAAREIRSPAPVEHIERLRIRVGLELPPELLAWWALMDGVDDQRDHGAGNRSVELIPKGYLPLSVARAEEEYARQSQYPDPGCCNADGTHRKRAGAGGFPFCTAVLPIGRAIDGGLLCVDLRQGEHHGRVMEWYASEGIYESDWASVTEIVDEIAERLDEREPPPVIGEAAEQ